MQADIPVNLESTHPNEPITRRITTEEHALQIEDPVKPKCLCSFGSTSCAELEYAYYYIRKQFPEWPDAEKDQFSIPNSIFLKRLTNESFYHHSFSHNRLSAEEFTRMLDYFRKEFEGVRKKYFVWKNLRISLFFSFIGLTTIFFVSFFTTGIVSDRAMTLYFSLFALLVYTFFLVTVHLASLKTVLLYNLKAFFLQVSLEQLQPRSLSIQCDHEKITIRRSPAEYDEVNENLLNLSDYCIKILPEPDIFRYYFSSDLTAACQKERFDPDIVDRKFSLEDFEELKRIVCKEHPFATRYFKMTAFPRWLTIALYPSWIIFYMVCVFVIPNKSIIPSKNSFGLLAPVYTVIVPHVVAGLAFFLFRYVPNAFLKPRINNTLLKFSMKILKGKKAAFRVNTQNNSVYLFSLDPKVAPLPVKRKIPYFLNPIDVKMTDLDTTQKSTDDGKPDELPLEVKKDSVKKKKKIELHQLGGRKLPKVTVTLDDLDPQGRGQRALKRFYCAHSNTHFDDADAHRRHCVAHTQMFTIQSGKHAVECHYIDQLPSLKKYKEFLKTHKEELSHNEDTPPKQFSTPSTRHDLISTSIAMDNDSIIPGSTRIFETHQQTQIDILKELNQVATIEEIIEEEMSAGMQQGMNQSERCKSRDSEKFEKHLQNVFAGLTMQEIAEYIEHL